MSATETSLPTPTSLVIAGGSVGFNWLPVFVAQRQGIFSQHGLSVESRRMGAVDKATAAVKSGEADLAITPPEGAVADCLREGNLRIVAGNVNRLPLTLIANPRYSRIEDLKGGRLGTSSLTEGTAIYTMEVLARHGLHYPEDYSFAVVGVHPARWQALQEGTIDAAVQLIPLNFVAIDAGYANLGEVTDYIPEIIFTALIGRSDWLRDHAETVTALLRSLIEATRWLYDTNNDAALIPLVSEITQCDAQYARTSLTYMRAKSVFARSLEIPDAALEKTLELMIKARLLDANAASKARTVVDDSFRQRALSA
jgi:ABC-type nitrate/sulfonate/bicarbonate transport system substrate-binding protein